MKRSLTLLGTLAVFLLIEGCYLGGAVRRAVTGEPPDPVVDGASTAGKEALYVTVYAVLRELSGFAAAYMKSTVAKRAGDLLPPKPPV